MKRLKTIFACMLMTFLSIGQVWAEDVTGTINFGSASGSTNINGASVSGDDSQDNEWTVKTVGTTSFTPNAGYAQVGSSSKPATSITFSMKLGSVQTFSAKNFSAKFGGFSNTAGTIAMKVTNTSTGVTTSVGSGSLNASNDVTVESSSAGTGDSLTITITSISKGVKCYWISYTYSTGGGATPSLSLNPTSKEFDAEDNSAQVIGLTAANFTSAVSNVTCAFYSEAACTTSITRPSWVNEPTVNAGKTQVSVNVEDNDGAARQTWMKITASDGSESASAVFAISQKKYTEPTGTFELFSGDLEEGDYVIVYDNCALNTTVSSNRLSYTSVTPSEDKIIDPDGSLIWHIAPVSETTYWTLYNAVEEKYAASTSSKNQATIAGGDLTDNMKWTITGSSTYDFENLARSSGSDSGNKWLRKNGTYGYACYATGTGGALTLYKKQVEGQPKAPTFSVPGGNYENAQSVELSCETQGAKIYYTLDGSKPSSTSTEYSTAIPVSATTTIKAVAIKDEIESTVATATYTIIVWQTVADVWDDITADGPTNAHIYGYVSQTNVGGYANNFYISDNGSTEGNQLYAYRMDMNSFSVEVGDKVKLAGDLTIVNEKKQFKYANSGATQGKVIALEAKGALQSVAVSGTPTKTEYASGEDFDPAGLKVYGTYENGFVGEIADGITWGNDLTDGKVTENTTVHVTATVNEVASPAYDVAVTVAAKTLESIAVGTASYIIYTGETLPKPVVTATFSEGEPEDVSAFAVYDSENVFDTEIIDNPDPQTITVSYTFGGATETVTYTVSVKDYANANDAPYTVTEALHIITDAIGSTESAREIVVAGTVNEDNISNNKNRYKISDGENELLVYAGKGFESVAFTNTNYPKVGDVVIVKGKVINFQGNTPEFASGKSYLLSQVRPTTLAIEDIASFEVGATDLTESDLDITTASDGDITFVSGDETKATIVANVAIHAVAPGTVTITANLAATSHEDALNYAATSTTFDVTVVAATVKYAITFDGNDNTGGEAPEFDAEAAEGANITLPANTYTKTGKIFDGWKVINNTTSAEVEVTAGAFTMPASAVTIQAQWAEPSSWALTYTSNVNIGTDSVILSSVKYAAKKAGTGSAWGSTTVMVPMGTTKLHFHAVCYGADASAVTLNVKKGESVIGTFIINKDAGAKGNSPFTLDNTPYQQYYSVTLSNISAETTLTFEADQEAEVNGKRFIIFGVNQEGGILPVLDHIAISGTMTNTTGWKTGDEITPEGLTVNAYYTLNDVLQDDPVDVTSSVVWSHAALVEDQTEVTLTATYTEGEEQKTANTNVTIEAVETGESIISTDANNRYWTVEQDAVAENKTFTVTLKNVAAATATLGGDNPEAFNIDKTALVDGDVITVSVVSTATVGVYTATITISDDANVAEDKVVNVSLTVNEPEVEETAVSTSSEWVAATEIVDGMQVLITGVKNEVTYAMGTQNNNNRAAVAGELDGEGVFTPGANTMAFTVVAQGDDTYALRTSNGKYLYAAASGSNYLKTQDEVDVNAKWTLSVTSASAESSSNRHVMQFNTSSTLFSCYASAGGNGMAAILLYVPYIAPEPEPEYTTVRTELTAGYYYTMCLDKAVTEVRGASIWRVLSKAENGSDIILEEVTGTLDAGRPYIFNASASTLQVAYTGDAVGAAVNDEDNNGLVGSFSETKIDQSPNNYIIYNNALYYVNSNNVYVGEHRAYLDMTGVPAYDNDEPQVGNVQGRRRVVMNVNNGNQMPTGIEGIEVSEAPRKVMIDGQLFILRDKKMYDASGRLVK